MDKAKLIKAWLDERIRELEKDVSGLEDQVGAIEAEKSRLLAQPSSSRASTFLDVPRDLYEKWIYAPNWTYSEI